jgi:hypothetical protein
LNKIITAALAVTFMAVAPAAFAKKSHRSSHAVATGSGATGSATTNNSGKAVGRGAATQTGVHDQAGSGGAAGGIGR